MGRLVTMRRTQLGSLHCMAQNPYNAIVHLGHHNGEGGRGREGEGRRR